MASINLSLQEWTMTFNLQVKGVIKVTSERFDFGGLEKSMRKGYGNITFLFLGLFLGTKGQNSWGYHLWEMRGSGGI